MIFKIELPERHKLICIRVKSPYEDDPGGYQLLVEYHAPEFHFLSFYGSAYYPDVLLACERAYNSYVHYSLHQSAPRPVQLSSALSALNIEIDI